MFFMSCVASRESEFLSCASRLTVTLRTVAFATRSRITASSYSFLPVAPGFTEQTVQRATFLQSATIAVTLTFTFAVIRHANHPRNGMRRDRSPDTAERSVPLGHMTLD
jgi:hypothetical protein